MFRTSDANVTGGSPYTRESSADSDGARGRRRALFSLPNGEPASFLLHNFENADLTRRIIEQGGRTTDVDAAADVILTTMPDEYKYLKDKYAISRKTYVRMSGFVDRCINAHRFRLAPVIEKGVPGRRVRSRRTEFTEEDDEHLCQYIAEVLPDKAEGGRTGHFIYADLIRRADEFGQYDWAHRHPKDGWRERYRKNQERLDNRITEIVQGNPPAPDGKGRYKFRRYGRIDQDHEWVNAYEDDLAEFDAEEGGDSATDDECVPIQTKRMDARPQEDEEDEDERQAVKHHSGAKVGPHHQDAEAPEEFEEQTTDHQPKKGPRTRAATRRSRVSPVGTLAPKRRRTKAAPQVLEEPVFDDLDATLRGTQADDKLAEEPDPSPVDPEQPDPPPVASEMRQPDTGRGKRGKPRARPIVRPLSPRRTRARSQLRSVNPHDAASASFQTNLRAKSKSKVSATTAAAPEPVPEPQVSDEFIADSDDEVEANLQVGVESRGGPPDNVQTQSRSADGLQTSRHLQGALRNDAVVTDPDNFDEDEDNSDAELFAHARKLDARARERLPPRPTASPSKTDDLDRNPSEEIFPLPGTRAGAEKERLTQAAKVAPYIPPRGTRAASMVEEERARGASVRRR